MLKSPFVRLKINNLQQPAPHVCSLACSCSLLTVYPSTLSLSLCCRVHLQPFYDFLLRSHALAIALLLASPLRHSHSFSLALSLPSGTIIIAAVFTVCCFSICILHYSHFGWVFFRRFSCLFQVQPTFVFVVPKKCSQYTQRRIHTHIHTRTPTHPPI